MTRTLSLGEICDRSGGSVQTGPFGSQLHQSDYSDSGIPVVMPQDIINDRISTEAIARIPEIKARDLSRHALKPGDIVFPRRGDIGKRALIGETEAGWLCGTGCLKIALNSKELHPGYFFNYLKLPHVVQWIEQKAVGATMLNLNTSILRGLEVTFPEWEEQLRVSRILNSYDDLIQANLRRIALLEEAARLIYRECFVHLRFPGHERVRVVEGVPEGWERSTIGAICHERTERIDPTKIPPETPYVGLEHIPRESIALLQWGRADEVASQKLSFCKLDVLFGKIRPYFHKVAIAPVDGVCSSDAIVMRPMDPRLHWYMAAVASSTSFVAHASQTSKEGSKMPRANWKVMAQFPCWRAPDATLAAFNEVVGPMVHQILALAHMTQQLQAARDLLLPRLMSGSLEVP